MNLRQSVVKPIHAYWIVELQNHMTTGKGNKNIAIGWRTAGIEDACKILIKKLTSS